MYICFYSIINLTPFLECQSKFHQGNLVCLRKSQEVIEKLDCFFFKYFLDTSLDQCAFVEISYKLNCLTHEKTAELTARKKKLVLFPQLNNAFVGLLKSFRSNTVKT